MPAITVLSSDLITEIPHSGWRELTRLGAAVGEARRAEPAVVPWRARRFCRGSPSPSAVLKANDG